MDSIRPTRAVVVVLKVFTDKLDAGPGGRTEDYSTYGYELMQETGYGSGKVYSILMRLVNAGWLERLNNPDARPESGGPPRITYQLRPEAVPAARRLIAEARKEFAPARKRRAPGAAVRALGWR
jgi:DNA-binding PadR family transcriptional regulator